MLHHDRIDISKKIDLTKRNNEKCTICHYCFFNYRFKFQAYICKSRHDLKILCLNPIQDEKEKGLPCQFFPCNFYKQELDSRIF